MVVLVTGVAGFIGGHLSRRLADEGHTVVGVDDLSAGVLENVDPRVTFHKTDIRSHDMRRLVEGVDAVFHLAAKNCLIDCLRDPVLTAEVNVAGTANVLEAARVAGVRKVIFADTSAEYEGITEFPSRVDRIAPMSIYASSKRAASLFCEAYQRNFGLHVTLVRYFNVYGPAQDWRRSMPPVMSAFILRILKGEQPVIYGNGTKRRDFIYIDDVTDFNLLALNDARTDGHTYNVGTGTNYSINEIFAAVAKMLGSDIQPVYRDELPGEAEITLADITNERALGWEPKVSLAEGLVHSARYVREHILPATAAAPAQ